MLESKASYVIECVCFSGRGVGADEFCSWMFNWILVIIPFIVGCLSDGRSSGAYLEFSAAYVYTVIPKCRLCL